MDVRAALVEATMKVFAEVGIRGATTRRIAQAADVNEVTLFRHFKTKEDLLQAALETFARQTITGTLPTEPTHPRAELLAWCLAHHRELYKHRAFIRKAMGEFEEHPAHCACGMQAAVGVARELTTYFGRLKARGLARGTWDERAASNTLLGAIFSDAMGRDTMPERYPHRMRESVEGYVDLLVRAIDATDASPLRAKRQGRAKSTTLQPRPRKVALRKPARGRTA
jgi:AcrR family transcriptional regulator